uniref:Uncharacterized protein n=1 Tax=Neogobius melanostomus TaxID=47308 RepID=A0A8C6URN5_9GOBI
NIIDELFYNFSHQKELRSRVQKVGTMPDSPADVKTQPRSTPPTMPPPPPAVSQATNRNASFTPTTSKSSKSNLQFTPILSMSDYQ